MLGRLQALGATAVLVAAITLAGCGGAASRTTPPVSTTSSALSGHARVEQAVASAHRGRSYRVRGELDGLAGPVVTWLGLVVGVDEQAVTSIGGTTFESRRIGGVLWTRRLEPEEPWTQLPLDRPLDLTALSRGSEVRSELRDGRWVVELAYKDVDVLQALTHIPSAGPSTVEVTVEDQGLATVVVRLGNGVTARLAYADFGADLTVEPVTTSVTSGPADAPGRASTA